MTVSKSRTRRNRKRSRRFSRHRKQRGGAVVHFQVYVFTKTELTDAEKAQILDVLTTLYGAGVEEYTGSNNFFRNTELEQIKEFVYTKGKHYPTLEHVTTFIIPSIPDALTEDVMNDDKLTEEEYKIRDELRRKRFPFKLVQAQHGLWSQELALIALERGDPMKN